MVKHTQSNETDTPSDEEIYEYFEQRTFNNYEQIASYYADEIDMIPELDTALKNYVYWAAIKRNIMQSFSEDDPVKIKELIGSEVNGIKVTDEMYQNAAFVYDNYVKSYDATKVILKELSLHYSKYVKNK